jgi:hypothetical protein
MARLGRLPKVGDVAEGDGFTLTVTTVDGRRAGRLQFRANPEPETEGDDRADVKGDDRAEAVAGSSAVARAGNEADARTRTAAVESSAKAAPVRR